MKKKILAVVLGLALCLGMTGCASWDRAVTDIKSDVNGGMQRTITVYALFDEMRAGGGSAVAYAWYEFEKGYTGESKLKWIN